MKLTPIRNPTSGTRVKAKKAKESSSGGLFSGDRKMCDISGFGPNLEYGSTGCGGGRDAFSGGSGKSKST